MKHGAGLKREATGYQERKGRSQKRKDSVNTLYYGDNLTILRNEIASKSV
jgi:hypothetical protein